MPLKELQLPAYYIVMEIKIIEEPNKTTYTFKTSIHIIFTNISLATPIIMKEKEEE